MAQVTLTVHEAMPNEALIEFEPVGWAFLDDRVVPKWIGTMSNTLVPSITHIHSMGLPYMLIN